MKTLFVDENGRLRSGWRATFFLIAFLVVARGLIGVALVFIAELPVSESTFGMLRLAVPFSISAALALLMGWVMGRVLENVPFRALGASPLRGWFKHLALGAALGGFGFITAVIVATTSGSLAFEVNKLSAPRDIATTLVVTLIVFAFGAASEETLFRGYLLQTFSRSKLGWFGVVFTSVLFALGHAVNPDVSKLAILNTLIAGVWFAIAWFRTRDLWFPFGIHIIWNWLQGPIFGINVSGIKEVASDPLLRAIDNGPELMTGGSYGIEGGLACTIALVMSIGLTVYLPGITPNEELIGLTSNNQRIE